MRIVLDAMGSDTYPDPEVQASIEAARQFGDEILLVGNEEQLKPRFQALGGIPGQVHIVHAPEVLEMSDKPAENARHKAQNSMAVGLELIKNGAGDAFVTAGNTGGAMVNALFTLGRIRGVKRPGLTGIFPVKDGRCIVLDIGANTECRPLYLAQFAIMGSVYAEKVLGVTHPRVGLISNGEEASKGSQLVKETYPLLQVSGLNFIGNIEGKELFGGKVDVAVTDGFTGNVLLKSSEAVARLLTDIIKTQIKSSPLTMLGGLLAKPAFDKVKRIMDPAEVGAAPLLGINGLVFVGHGRSDARALVSAIRTARQAVQADLLNALRSAIQEKLDTLQISEESA